MSKGRYILNPNENSMHDKIKRRRFACSIFETKFIIYSANIKIMLSIYCHVVPPSHKGSARIFNLKQYSAKIDE